ncbi:conidial yellow pigment biosynthesis polyketide synthase [Apiospora rasikravindrae]|uniref:Conidial yellow pigment biosynthesis polyketide synthase n=1 Tax=Apiospora rasikravindrae TaxID=990691 RepID=A0ABR1RZB9_9PEZI
MELLGQCSDELSREVKVLSEGSSFPLGDVTDPDLNVTDPLSALVRQGSGDFTKAKRQVLHLSDRIRSLVAEPTDFIQHLSIQCQLLACLQWLADFHVLAYIPLTGSVPAKDIAELAGVPESQLTQNVRLLASAGFLSEPQSGLLSHTSLSAPFVTNVAYLDAINFLSQTVVPSAAHMTAATIVGQQRPQNGPRSGGGAAERAQSAYTQAFGPTHSFEAACEQKPKLLRQYRAYLQCIGDVDENADDADAVELLLQLDWHALGNARVVMVNANSTRVADALSARYPPLRFVVQMTELHALSNSIMGEGSAANGQTGSVAVSYRASGSFQPVEDAAVYIIQCSRSNSQQIPETDLQAELRAHKGILRNNPSATVVLTPRLLPALGALDPSVETVARLRDMSRLQLTNERDTELDEFVGALDTVQDGTGRLVVVNQLSLRRTTMMALGVKYQSINVTT